MRSGDGGGIGTISITTGGEDEGPRRVSVDIPKPVLAARKILELRGDETLTLMNAISETLLVSEAVVIAGYDPAHKTMAMQAHLVLSDDYVSVGANRREYLKFKKFMDNVVDAIGSWIEAHRDLGLRKISVTSAGTNQWAVMVRDEPSGIEYAIRFENWTTSRGRELINVLVEPAGVAGTFGIKTKGAPDEVLHVMEKFANLLGCVLEALYSQVGATQWPAKFTYRLEV